LTNSLTGKTVTVFQSRRARREDSDQLYADFMVQVEGSEKFQSRRARREDSDVNVELHMKGMPQSVFQSRRARREDSDAIVAGLIANQPRFNLDAREGRILTKMAQKH